MSKIGPLLSEGHWCLEAGKQNASFKTSGGRHRNIVLSVQDENEKKREKELNHVFLPPPHWQTQYLARVIVQRIYVE